MKLGSPDTDLERRIRIFLAMVAFPDPDRIGISVTGGTVELRGLLANARERELSVAYCRRVAGVLRIVDELSVPASRAPQRSLVEGALV